MEVLLHILFKQLQMVNDSVCTTEIWMHAGGWLSMKEAKDLLKAIAKSDSSILSAKPTS